MHHEFGRLTRRELQALDDPLVIVPLGATEQHGDQLAVGADAVIVTAIAGAVADRLGTSAEVVVTPTIPIGISGHHLPFGGTLTFSAEVYAGMLHDLVIGLRRQALRRTLLLNGHGGNDAAMRTAVERLALVEEPGGTTAGLSYWDAVPAETAAALPAPVPGHAGRFETSLLKALRPDLVRDPGGDADTGPRPLAHEIPGLRADRTRDWRSSDGVTDGAGAATAEFGRTALAGIVAEITARVGEYFAIPAGGGER
ncbi:creatininase family protein [Jiangella muralis]|uniref:creatininase family protein n=1 Tax=Jiangella muralis TaxID=702383 RepID=UPI00069F15B9|nr:creatininase family protein [Jiangella muralis]